MKLKILYEDNHLIVLNKPAGILSQGDSSRRISLVQEVKSYLRQKYSKPGNVFLGVVHRLDLLVSGIIIYAKTSKAASRMHKLFSERAVEKIYCAMVNSQSKPPNSWTSLKDKIVRNHNVSEITEESGTEGQDASLEYIRVGSNLNNHLFLIRLHTGRKHQIRAQLSHAGFSIAGDVKYGSEQIIPGHGIALHACYMRFTHPVTKENIELFSPPPVQNWPGCPQFNLNAKIIREILLVENPSL